MTNIYVFRGISNIFYSFLYLYPIINGGITNYLYILLIIRPLFLRVL